MLRLIKTFRRNICSDHTHTSILNVCNMMEQRERRRKILYKEFINKTDHYDDLFNNNSHNDDRIDAIINLSTLSHTHNFDKTHVLLTLHNSLISNNVYPRRKYLDYEQAEKIIKSANELNHNFINTIHGTTIKTRFNDDTNNCYNISQYRREYGNINLYRALVSLVNMSNITSGEDSIYNEHTIELIKDKVLMISKNDNILAHKLYNDIVWLTNHDNNDTQIRIEKLMEKYYIKSYELMFMMYKFNKPNNTVIYDYIINKNSENDLTLYDVKKLFDSDNEENKYLTIDYLYGIPIKNSFRKYNKYDNIQMIRIKEYDALTDNGKFYECLLRLMKYKIENKYQGIII